MKANCYECQYRGIVAGDAHSCCKHVGVNDTFDIVAKAQTGCICYARQKSL